MRKIISSLAFLLVAQLALVAALGLGSSTLSAGPGAAPLLELGDDKLSRILLSGEAEQVELVKTEAGWRLGSAEGFPADQTKVQTLLRRLGELRLGAPVATSESARERFKVAEATFERRIELGAEELALPVFYLGTSVSMRQSHLRRAGEAEIYTVEFASYEAPTDPDEWRDKSLLQFDVEELVSIEVGELRLERAAEEESVDWRALDGTDVDPAAVTRLAEALAGLRIAGVLEDAAEPESLELALSVALRSGEVHEYRLSRLAEGEGYALQHSVRSETLRLPAHAGDRLIEAAAREALTAKSNGESSADEA